MPRWERTGALRPYYAHPLKQCKGVSLTLIGIMLIWTRQPALAVKVQLSEGTKIRVEVAEELSSRRSHKGQEVRYYVKEDVLGPNKEVLIRKGAPASGMVTVAKGAGGLGKKGKLEFTIESVVALDGTKVPLRARQAAVGKNQTGSVAAGVILFGVFGAFIKGKNVTVPQGTLIDAYIDQTVEIEVDSAGTNNIVTVPQSAPSTLICVLALTNGDKVTGTFVEFKDGTLNVHTDLGTVRVSLDRIDTLTPKDDKSSTSPPIFVIVRKNGAKATGQVKGLKDKVFTIETTKGMLTVPAADITSIELEKQGK